MNHRELRGPGHGFDFGFVETEPITLGEFFRQLSSQEVSRLGAVALALAELPNESMATVFVSLEKVLQTALMGRMPPHLRAMVLQGLFPTNPSEQINFNVA